jgi:MOSC domain-containing protein YiiM
MLAEPCGHCGFDSHDYTHSDLVGTVRALTPIWRTMTEEISESVLATRPAPEAWSAIERAAYSRHVIDAIADAVTSSTANDAPARVVLPSESSPREVPTTMAEALVELDAGIVRLNATAGEWRGAEWSRSVVVDDHAVTVGSLVAHAVHVGTHQVRDAGRALHALGAGAPSHRGAVVQVSASNGGVPKAALASASIGRRGVVGDRQAERQHHGRPLQALCLWSQDVIDSLREEGHSIYAGAAGENVTVAGVDWSTIRPGVRLAIGAVNVEISAFATPCAKNAQWFRDGKFRRIDHNARPGWSRAYAWVLDGGQIAPGDPVLVEP